ncbi:C-factor [Monoraphidium neglectum]|uniref:C-factor n=1 Tax=Monoraphidium neglectum TaxID=145388 RepID=A0A0D2KKQ9_9CHLO|nr:C-factor [Monoraphidium neglectum]KIY96373.1 C-factor [Monoraphidium neglectum]|eukprot:XP_013895393.1 C-factor [Monoraphidium neglectum]
MITGKTGIGRGLVEKLLARGNTVIATTRSADAPSSEPLRRLAAEHPARLVVTELDTASQGSVEAWAAALKDQHKIKHVDLLINNAGIYSGDGRRPKLEEFTAADFLPVFMTNSVGPFLVIQQLLARQLLGPPGSLVVNVSSIMGSNSDPTVSAVTPGAYAYRASKAALNSVTTTLARDFERDGRQIQCCLVHPGYVKTDMTSGQGWVEVEESAAGILKVLEDGRPLNGRWYSFNGDEIPW